MAHIASALVSLVQMQPSRDVPSCKEVWETQTLVGQSSAYLKSRSSPTKGNSKRVDAGDKQLTVFSLVTSLVLTVT